MLLFRVGGVGLEKGSGEDAALNDGGLIAVLFLSYVDGQFTVLLNFYFASLYSLDIDIP